MQVGRDTGIPRDIPKEEDTQTRRRGTPLRNYGRRTLRSKGLDTFPGTMARAPDDKTDVHVRTHEREEDPNHEGTLRTVLQAPDGAEHRGTPEEPTDNRTITKRGKQGM